MISTSSVAGLCEAGRPDRGQLQKASPTSRRERAAGTLGTAVCPFVRGAHRGLRCLDAQPAAFRRQKRGQHARETGVWAVPGTVSWPIPAERRIGSAGVSGISVARLCRFGMVTVLPLPARQPAPFRGASFTQCRLRVRCCRCAEGRRRPGRAAVRARDRPRHVGRAAADRSWCR